MKSGRSSRRTERRGGRRSRLRLTNGFTLVEVLAALLMMAIVIPVAMQGMSTASRAGILGQRKAAAMRIAERVINELVVENQAAQNSTSGTMQEGDTNYPWTARAESWSEDPMTQLTVTVTFTLQGNSYEVTASTLVGQGSTTAVVP